jgi:hypothetical protein
MKCMIFCAYTYATKYSRSRLISMLPARQPTTDCWFTSDHKVKVVKRLGSGVVKVHTQTSMLLWSTAILPRC